MMDLSHEIEQLSLSQLKVENDLLMIELAPLRRELSRYAEQHPDGV